MKSTFLLECVRLIKWKILDINRSNGELCHFLVVKSIKVIRHKFGIDKVGASVVNARLDKVMALVSRHPISNIRNPIRNMF